MLTEMAASAVAASVVAASVVAVSVVVAPVVAASVVVAPVSHWSPRRVLAVLMLMATARVEE